jgi:ectoine hydroxylase-related dioxygenase (phytanoyl-CoA dioxygenase family)
MDAWFSALANTRALPAAAARALDEDGFAVLDGPIEPGALAQLAAAYDAAVESADPVDRSNGRTGSTTRVHDFVNRDPAFDGLYVHPPLLEACCRIIGRPFKLSTMHARTLHPRTPAQGLHMDFPREPADYAVGRWPMVGFIVMIDPFTADNGATLFVPGSHTWSRPQNDAPADHPDQTPACGPAGSVIVFNGSAWHGHGANATSAPRRSLQGAFIRRDACGWINLPARMQPDTLARISDLAKYVVDVERRPSASDPV